MLRSRPYAGDGDAILVAAIAARAASNSPQCAYWHPGDIWWSIYQNSVQDPTTMIRMWEDSQGAVAFALMFRDGTLGWDIIPEYGAKQELAADIMHWGDQHVSTLAGGSHAAPSLKVSAFDHDVERVSMLTKMGFQRGNDPLLHFAQALDPPLPSVTAPPGFTIRNVAEEHEWEERVEIHRDVWHPSRVTLDAYRRLRTVPGYSPDLDLIAVDSSGRIGAYCIVWWDEALRTGEFEPVGTRAEYRRLGVGRAVIMEGLRRLQARGARHALVYTPRSNAPAPRFYESCGFRVVGEEYFWTRP